MAPDSLLLFDEADSLLFDRSTARTSWEVGQVNELLTWLDQHPLPVIAANWGGPADYIDSQCGVLVDIESTDQFVRDLSAAMLRLAMDPALRETMGRAGRERVLRHFTWDQKTDQIIQLYREAADSNQKR